MVVANVVVVVDVAVTRVSSFVRICIWTVTSSSEDSCVSSMWADSIDEKLLFKNSFWTGIEFYNFIWC